MLPLVCNDAVAILFMFDLSRKSTLNSIKEWYRQARGFNKTAVPFLVGWLDLVFIYSCLTCAGQIGTKYDQFSAFTREEQEEITRQVHRTPISRCTIYGRLRKTISHSPAASPGQ